MNRKLILSAFPILVAAPALAAEPQPAGDELAVAGAPAPVVAKEKAPATYDVFIDGVTGYAFVRTPKGWTFVRNLKDEAR